ncbi:DoxX family membrane protein [Corynebacterium sp. c9Ua_112]|uniref:DoxX family membrane protein n=1 Tax=Corynebacterium macclintockiae TaxID=2913501 RepID=A0A9X3RPB4_9CORY|nr:DoxX family membrane protein [Corynebacterium macclintockiae]
MSNNAKPNSPRPDRIRRPSPDDALFDNSADELADDMNNDIDVPVYRRDARADADEKPQPKEASTGATKIAKPADVDAPKPAENSAENSAEAEATAPADASAPEANANVGNSDEATEKPAKRDVYAMLGRARPQRIESRSPDAAPTRTDDANTDHPETDSASDVDLTKLDGSEASSGSGTAAAAGAAAGAGLGATTAGGSSSAKGDEDRWGKVDDAETSEFRGAGADVGEREIPANAAGGAVGGAGAASAAGAGVTGAGVPGDAQGADVTRNPGGDETTGAGANVGEREIPANAAGGAGGAGAEDSQSVAKRGTTSFGLFLLRVVLGAYLLVRGLQTLFAFGGDPGLEVFQGQLESYNFTDILAIGIPVAEIVAGGLLLLGLLTPFGAAVATVVAGFMTFHNLNGFQGSLWPYGLNPYVQLWAALTVASISIIFVGPGRISLDRSRGWATRPLASAWIFFVVAAAATAGLWLGVGGGNPFN